LSEVKNINIFSDPKQKVLIGRFDYGSAEKFHGGQGGKKSLLGGRPVAHC